MRLAQVEPIGPHLKEMLRWRIGNTIFPKRTASAPFPTILGQILTQNSTWEPQKLSKHLNWTREEIGKFFALLCKREQNNIGHLQQAMSFFHVPLILFLKPFSTIKKTDMISCQSECEA